MKQSTKQLFDLDCLCHFCGQYDANIYHVLIADNYVARCCTACLPLATAVSALIITKENNQRMTSLIKNAFSKEKLAKQPKAPPLPKKEMKMLSDKMEKLALKGKLTSEKYAELTKDL